MEGNKKMLQMPEQDFNAVLNRIDILEKEVAILRRCIALNIAKEDKELAEAKAMIADIRKNVDAGISQ